MEALSRTMVMFQERICVKSFIRYCHDNKLFRSTWSFCHIDTICWWPASRLGDAREQQELVQKMRSLCNKKKKVIWLRP